MPRHVRQKHPSTPVKALKRRASDSSSLGLSDDDGYSAVDDISDSEDDDEDDVNAVEEENILIEVKRPARAPRPQPVASDGDDDGEDEEGDQGQGGDDDEDDDDHGLVRFGAANADDIASWAGIVSEPDGSQVSDLYDEPNTFAADATVARHVRFDVPSSDSDSTDTDEDDHGDLFPDIFVAQNSLDPAFRREIEHDPDESSGSGSFWDFSGQYEEQRDSDAEDVVHELGDNNDTPTATPRPAAAETPTPSAPSYEESLELDGYETDGDTTEEDIPESPVRRKTRRPSVPVSDDASDSDTESAVQPERGQPRVGRFNLDRSDRKPIAVLNPLTRKMMIFTPYRRRQLDLSPEQFNLPWALPEQSSPLLSSSANMMISAMMTSTAFDNLVNAQAMRPAEAFFPFPSEPNTADDSSTAAPSVEGEAEAEDEAEKQLDIDDFITWDDESSADEGAGNWDPSSTPLRPGTSAERDVLSHLKPETVGAFRRNQINQQLLLSNKATQDSLAFSGPYNYTALKGLKSDRFDTAAIPLTPIRRQKRHMGDAARSPLEQVSAKRKAAGDAAGPAGHKKHRSISDVNMLRI